VMRELSLACVVPDQFLPWFSPGGEAFDQEFGEKSLGLRFGVCDTQASLCQGEGECLPPDLRSGGSLLPSPDEVPDQASNLVAHPGIRVQRFRG
jgi:hypothetical protein